MSTPRWCATNPRWLVRSSLSSCQTPIESQCALSLPLFSPSDTGELDLPLPA
jgi:hypothetical protein